MSNPEVQPPVAKQVPHRWHRPSGDVDDPWAWLRDRDDPDTVAYLEAENRYAESFFAPHAELTETLFEEMITASYSLNQVNDALQAMASYQVVKAVIYFQ